MVIDCLKLERLKEIMFQESLELLSEDKNARFSGKIRCLAGMLRDLVLCR